MTLSSDVVHRTMMAAMVLVRGRGNLQTMLAIDQDPPRSRLSCTTVKYVKLAVLEPRYSEYSRAFQRLINSF